MGKIGFVAVLKDVLYKTRKFKSCKPWSQRKKKNSDSAKLLKSRFQALTERVAGGPSEVVCFLQDVFPALSPPHHKL